MGFQTADEYRAQVAAELAAKAKAEAEGEKQVKARRARKTTPAPAPAPAEQAVDDAPAGDEVE